MVIFTLRTFDVSVGFKGPNSTLSYALYTVFTYVTLEVADTINMYYLPSEY